MHGCSPRYSLYGVVSGECSCQLYCTTTGVHGWLCFEASPPPPPPVASDSKDEDDDDDDDASDDDDGDASSTDDLST